MQQLSHIHIYPNSTILKKNNNTIKVYPHIFDNRETELEITLLKKNFYPVYKCKLSKVAPFTLYFDDKKISIHTDEYSISQIESFKDSQSPWYILRMHVSEAKDNTWHASYAVILPNSESYRHWIHHRGKIFLKYAKNISTLAPLWPANKIVRIVARNIVTQDAVSNFSIGLAGTLTRFGIPVRLYAHDTSPEYAGIVCPTALLQNELLSNDIIFYNYSIFDDFIPFINKLSCYKKILFYHNVTPGIWFNDYDARFSSRLDDVHKQYSVFSNFKAVIANSTFSLENILPHIKKDTPTLVHPPFFSLHRLKVTPEPLPLPQSRYLILWVGRCAPHKRPELAMQIFGELIKLDMDASLILVGGGWHDFPAYGQMLDACLASLPPETRQRIQHLENLTDGQLAFLYRHASVLLCTSAHEGYCMPLAEASAFGTPIAAMPQPAVEETLNGTGCILPEDPQQAAHRLRDFLLCGGKMPSTAGRTAKTQVDPDAFLALLE